MAKAKKDHIKDATDLLEIHLQKTGIDPTSAEGKAQLKAAAEDLESLTVDKVVERIAEAKIFYDNFQYPGDPKEQVERDLLYSQVADVFREYMTEAGTDLETPESKGALANLQETMAKDDLEALRLRLSSAKADLERFKRSKNPQQGQTGPAQGSAAVVDSQEQDKETLALMKKASEEDLALLTQSLKTLPVSAEVQKAGKPRVISGQASYLDTKTGITHFDSIEQVRLIIKYNPNRFTHLS